jgi:hypothetical protein
MQKISLFIITVFFAVNLQAQNCAKGCAKVTKVSPTTIKGLKPNRALLEFKFVGPAGRPATKWIKIVLDNDTISPQVDITGTTKLTSKPGPHKLKFKAPYWYIVSMDQLVLKDKMTYQILVKFASEEIIGGTRTKG